MPAIDPIDRVNLVALLHNLGFNIPNIGTILSLREQVVRSALRKAQRGGLLNSKRPRPGASTQLNIFLRLARKEPMPSGAPPWVWTHVRNLQFTAYGLTARPQDLTPRQQQMRQLLEEVVVAHNTIKDLNAKLAAQQAELDRLRGTNADEEDEPPRPGLPPRY